MAQITENYEVTSPFRNVDFPFVGLWKFMANSFKRCHNEVAIVDPVNNINLTYKQLLHFAENVSSCLVNDYGFNPDKPLVLCMTNCSEFLIAMLAAWKLGGSVGLINPLLTDAEIRKQLNILNSDCLVCCNMAVTKCVSASKKSTIKNIFTKGHQEGCIPFSDLCNTERTSLHTDAKEIYQINPKLRTAIIPFSSGTTGLPKGVELTHLAVIEQTCYFKHVVLHNCRNGVVLYQPFSHMWGLEILISFLCSGQKIIILNKFNLEQYIQLVAKYKVEMLFLVPPVAVMLANSNLLFKYDLSHVKTIISSAAPLSKELEQQIKHKLNNKPKLTQALGMTELTCLAIIVPSFHTNLPCPQGSVGWPNCNTLIKVVDPVRNTNLKPGEKGEICFKSTYIMKGYFNNPSATQQTIDKDGWLHGGDIGYYDTNGCFFVVDRLKELIKYKGYQVAPAELEAVLLSHPGIIDAGVTSVPDLEAGELPYAWVVQETNSKLKENDIHTYVNERVAPFKRLRGGIKFVQQIPKSPSGKILRRLIREKTKHMSKL